LKNISLYIILNLLVLISCKNNETNERELQNEIISIEELEYDVLNQYLDYNKELILPYLEINEALYDTLKLKYNRHINSNESFKFSTILIDSLGSIRKNVLLNYYYYDFWDTSFINIDSIKFTELNSRQLNLNKLQPIKKFNLLKINNISSIVIDSLNNTESFTGYQFFSRMIFNKEKNSVLFFRDYSNKWDGATKIIKLKKVNSVWVLDKEKIILYKN
jgi:hypothetical protein